MAITGTPEERFYELFVEQGKTAKEVSQILDIALSSCYRHIKNKNLKGKRDKWITTANTMSNQMRLSLPELLKKFQADPNASTADAILKVIKSIKAIKKDSDYVGNALSVMKEFALYLRNVAPEKAEIISDHIDGFISKIYQENKE